MKVQCRSAVESAGCAEQRKHASQLAIVGQPAEAFVEGQLTTARDESGVEHAGIHDASTLGCVRKQSRDIRDGVWLRQCGDSSWN